MQHTGVTQLGVRWINNQAHIRVWAPMATSVNCLLSEREIILPLEKQKYGYWYTKSDQPLRNERYKIIINDKAYPDPASLYQPEGVHGPSAMIDLAYSWTDHNYLAPKQQELIIYELHVGTFSASHSFYGVIERIPYLKELGINAIELMPVGQFAGERNWGYDGVYAFAVHHSYGGARALQQLVDACHQAGIAIILDVVYNHFGPEGNYLPAFGPYFTAKYHTPWGEAVNYDDALNHGVRDFVLANIRMWFEDFHIDGLRMDAVHAIKDFGPAHILQDIRRLTEDIVTKTGKQRYLFIECDLNDRRFLDPLEVNGFAMDGQWLDEFHHALRVAAGEERKGYYKEFEGVSHLAKAYQNAYVFDGCYSSHRQKFFGTDSTGITGKHFIVFSQNHDQVGNRMLGERSSVLYSPETTRLMALAVFLSPYIPLLFMGEEWGTKKPFLYFVSHSDPKLVKNVQEGRKREFEAFQIQGAVPDPQDNATFQRSVLDWKETQIEPYRQHLAYYKALIDLRKSHPIIKNLRREELTMECLTGQGVLILRAEKQQVKILAVMNFSGETQHIYLNEDQLWELIFHSQMITAEMPGIEGMQSVHKLTISAWTGLVFQKEKS
ncbi:malto-oligosyltrehalose trehalohydrolase [Sphingobacterium sp. HMA12]|uniref:malto-oligosyltrehalose trehalohydrolase n=1 Tax=Sphingobacterium sp. HMA12 TaxID=2050894 RepID=UPI000CE9E20F|nr:malto-oligosyltrehalose trehalohydrolase [Sphingobacterium sp. HMA12]